MIEPGIFWLNKLQYSLSY